MIKSKISKEQRLKSYKKTLSSKKLFKKDIFEMIKGTTFEYQKEDFDWNDPTIDSKARKK